MSHETHLLAVWDGNHETPVSVSSGANQVEEILIISHDDDDNDDNDDDNAVGRIGTSALLHCALTVALGHCMTV